MSDLNSSAKKIAIFIPSMHGGGAEKITQLLCNAIAGHGIVVDLVLVKAEGVFMQNLSPSIRIFNLNSSRSILSLFKLRKYLKKNRPDSMLSVMTESNLVASLAVYRNKEKTQLFLSEHITLSKVLKSQNPVKAKIIKVLCRFFYKRAVSVIAVSKGVASDLEHFIGLHISNIKVILNPVLDKDFDRKKQEPLEDPFFANQSLRYIISVGRLNEQKNFDTLIRAFEKIKKTFDVKLVILGEGHLRGKLENKIKELKLQNDVYMPGFVQNPYAWISRSSLFILSSIYEGFGLVLVEAMACGVSVISTDCPSGPREILEDGRLGLLVPVENPDEMAKAIIIGLEGKIAVAPTDVIKKKYSAELVAEKYISVLLTLSNKV